MITKIQLKPTCILNVPFNTYDKDFSFIVNGKEFKTSRLISDLLSPIICQNHINDPTYNYFTINTSTKGDFSHVLQLFNFTMNDIPPSEAPFISEILEILGNDSIKHEEAAEPIIINNENVFSYIKIHEQYPKIYDNFLRKDIEFISSHFYELCETYQEELEDISIDTLMRILNEDTLKIQNEDQLLRFINNLYRNDVNYSILYETVSFEYLTIEGMKEFISIYDINDTTSEIWSRLSKRLTMEIKFNENDQKSMKNNRYKDQNLQKKLEGEIFKLEDLNDFNGIINYLNFQSNGKIRITSSSVWSSSEKYQPRNVVLYDDQSKWFESNNVADSWICIDFVNNKVDPSDCVIRSAPYNKNGRNPKSWVIEGSNDQESWEILSEENNCQGLNGKNVVYAFKLNNQNSEEFRYLRMRATGPDFYGEDNLRIDSIEFFGRLI